MAYEFESESLEFGKGSLAELISYDRYAITSNGISSRKTGDVVIFVKQQGKETQLVGTVTHAVTDIGAMEVEAHDGSGLYNVLTEDTRLVRETRPAQLWSRWAEGAASVERANLQASVADDFRWLLDGYRYVPGGRIQNMLGLEFAELGLEKSNLSAYNCLVLPSPECSKTNTALQHWLDILGIAKREANAMAYGCGVGLNISTVPEKIVGPMSPPNVSFFIKSSHSEKGGFNADNFNNVGGRALRYSIDNLLVVTDSRFGIFDALIELVKRVYEAKEIVVDFSLLRPKGALVKGINGTSSGAVSWAKLFDFVVGLLRKPTVNAVDIGELFALVPHLISQGGQRRGALMLVMDVTHPNIEQFIVAKQDAGRITGANLSVNLTDEFMAKVIGKEHIYEHWLFDEISKLAHKSGEPGVLFMDRAQELSNSNYYQVIDATNPCGEEPLPPDGVCNLGHLNLPRFLVKRNSMWGIDTIMLTKAIRLGVRFNDNIIDYTPFFDKGIHNVQQGDRRIGVGTMGLATVLIKLGMRYGSKEAVDYARALNHFIADAAYKASIELGKEKGSFPNYDASQINETSFLYKITNGDIPTTLRNAAVLTQAPTGSTGTMIDNLPGYDCSTGIEPYFAFEYFRASRVGTTVKQEVDLARNWRLEHPDATELPPYFVGASEVLPTEHVNMQAAIQKYVDSATSKTINLPANATVEDVREAYLLAYKSGCKGVTVYRDGCRTGQVLATKKEDAKLEELVLNAIYNEEKEEYHCTECKYDHLMAHEGPCEACGIYTKGNWEAKVTAQTEILDRFVDEVAKRIETIEPFKKRPRVLTGKTIKQATPLGKMYVTINNSESDQIEEIFIQLGQVGSDVRAIVDSLGILLTLGLSNRLSHLNQEEKLTWLTGKLIGIKGSSPIGFGPTRIDSLPDALGKVLRDYSTVVVEDAHAPLADITIADDICAECGSASIRRIEGCEKCTNCGASKCG